MFRKKYWKDFALLIALLTISIWFLNNSFAGNEQRYLKTEKSLFYLRQVYETVLREYVDDVNPEGLSKSAIKGIVNQLDPYTVFFEKKGSERLRIITKGKYGGLGMEIGKREGKITIISPIDDTPAHRAGLRAGDVILKIDNQPSKELSLEEASNKLRGKIGTKVTLEIERPGLPEPLTLTLVREEIVLKDVSYADFVEPGTAYFRLTNFSEKAASELKNAIKELRDKGKIERAVLDLRGNPGGLLTAAVEVANIFIPKGSLIVTTKGEHEREAKFVTKHAAVLPTTPLVVLVNGGSASASEIVAGAVQDLDRGIIVGTPTFGKGLVQQVYPIDKIDDAFLKITTAKYYVPSGRCIQKEDYQKNKEIFSEVKDTTAFDNHKNYYTHNNRVVHGGGGIKPDMEVKAEKMDQYVMTLWSKGHFFRFAVNYLAEHPEIKENDSFIVNNQVLIDFREYLSQQKIDYQLDGVSELKKFLEIAEEEKYNADVRDLITVALQKLEKKKPLEFESNIKQIKESLQLEFAEKLGGTKSRTALRLKKDLVLKKALTLLENQTEYDEILAVK